MGLIGDVMNEITGGNSGKADSSAQAAIEAAKNIPLPVLKQYYPELYKQVVSLNPEMESAVDLGPSQMQGIATDPATRQAQLSALAKLQEIGSAGGEDAQSLADQAKIENDVNTNLKGQEDAIMQNLATRGMAGGGSELVAREMAAQGASNQQAQMALQAKAEAQQRALQALMQSGQLGSQMQQQDFSQQAQKAQAADAIAKFNAQNQQQVNNANVEAKNDAQKWNATTAQSTSNQNTGLNNQAQLYNNNLDQQNYDNQLKKTGMQIGAQNNLTNQYNNDANADRQFIGGVIGAGATAYGASKK